MTSITVSDRLHEEARLSDELHERSRAMLVRAVRSGAAAGLSQREIAAAIGRSQPEVSRLLHFHGKSILGRAVHRNRREIIATARRFGMQNVRVFGSVARGTDGPDSDVDLLVDLPADTSLFTVARIERELGELLGVKVDVLSAKNLRPRLATSVMAEAAPL